MTTLYVLPEPDHYCIADDTWSFTRALVAAEIAKAYQRGVESLVIDTCSMAHRFAKLPDHPMRDGQARCPHCLAIGFDKYRSLG